jgi:hypothetical protein
MEPTIPLDAPISAACARSLEPLRGIGKNLSQNGIRDRGQFSSILLSANCTEEGFLSFFLGEGFSLNSVIRRESRTIIELRYQRVPDG